MEGEKVPELDDTGAIDSTVSTSSSNLYLNESRLTQKSLAKPFKGIGWDALYYLDQFILPTQLSLIFVLCFGFLLFGSCPSIKGSDKSPNLRCIDILGFASFGCQRPYSTRRVFK